MKKGLLLLGIMIAAISLVGCKNEKETSKKIDLSNNQTKINTSKSNDKIIPDTEDISDDYLNERYPGKEILHWVYGEKFKLSNEDIEEFGSKYGTHLISNEQIITLNDYLVSKGKKYVINFIRMGCGQEYINQVKHMISNNNSPDIINANVFYDYDAKTYSILLKYDFIDAELLENLEPYMSENMKEYKENIPDSVYNKSKVNGKFYGIGSMEKTTTKMYWYINEDIAKKYDIDLESMKQMNYEDWAPYFEKIYNAEKNEGTSDFKIMDNYPYTQVEDTALGYIGKISGENYIDTKLFGKNEDTGLIENYYASDNVRQAFKNYTDYYKKEYFNYLNPTKKNEDEIFTGNCFAFLQQDMDVDSFVENNKTKYPKLKSVKKIYCYNQIEQFDELEDITGICSKSTKKEMAMDALNTIYSDRVSSNIASYPLYKIDREDYTENMDIENYAGPSKIFANVFVRYSSDYKKEGSELKKEEDLAKTSDKISGRYFDLNDSKDKIKRLVEIEKKYIDYSAELKGKFLNGDFDTTWNEFLKELDAAGIEEVIQLINGQIDK